MIIVQLMYKKQTVSSIFKILGKNLQKAVDILQSGGIIPPDNEMRM